LTLDMLRIRTRVLRLASLPPFPSILLGMDEAYLNKPFCGIIFLPALSQLPIADLPSIQKAIWMFYEDPTSPMIYDNLKLQIRQAVGKQYPEDIVASAASDYLRYLWEEMAFLPDLREKLSAISMVRTERNTAEIADTLRSKN